MHARVSGHPRFTHRRTTAAAAVLALTCVAGCTSPQGSSGSVAGPGGSAASEPPESARAEPIRLSTSFADAAAIPIEAPVSVSASGGSLDSVTVSPAVGDVAPAASAPST